MRNFVPALELIAARHPDVPVCLFMGSMPASTAAIAKRKIDSGTRYIPLLSAPFIPLVALLWPREKAAEFLFWSETAKTTRADDGNAGRWMRQTKQAVLVTVPSIVEHNDFIPSVKGGRDHVYGREKWRSALFLARDAMAYEW